MKRIIPIAMVIVAMLAGPLAVVGAEKKASAKTKPYPLDTCLVSEEKLDSMGEPHVFVHQGREVMLCCKDCKGEFEKHTAKFVAKIDEAAKKVKAYPLKTCVVSDEKLDDHGEPYVFVHALQEIQLCCKDCKTEFLKTPKKFLGKVKEAGKKK